MQAARQLTLSELLTGCLRLRGSSGSYCVCLLTSPNAAACPPLFYIYSRCWSPVNGGGGILAYSVGQRGTPQKLRAIEQPT